MSSIHVHIDRIVLRGVDPADRDALVSGLKSELARVLAHPEAAASYAVTRRTPVMRLGQIAMEPGLGGARKFGSSVARAIGKGMAR